MCDRNGKATMRVLEPEDDEVLDTTTDDCDDDEGEWAEDYGTEWQAWNEEMLEMEEMLRGGEDDEEGDGDEGGAP